MRSGDRIEYGPPAARWHGTVVSDPVYGATGRAFVDIQWDHCDPGDIDHAVDASILETPMS